MTRLRPLFQPCFGHEDGIAGGALLVQPLLAGAYRLVFLGPGHGRGGHGCVVERGDRGGIVLVGVVDAHVGVVAVLRTLVSSRQASLGSESKGVDSSGRGFG